MKTTLVTGANGFVGKNLIRQLSNCIEMDRNVHRLQQIESMKSILSKVDSIVHLVGLNAGTSSTPESSRMIQDNLDATYQLVKGIKLYAKTRPRVVFLSSIHVYESGHPVINEETPIGPSAVYGTIKYAQELILRQAAMMDLIDLVVFRSTHIYGPFAKPFYNSAVATLCHNAIQKKPIDLYGKGKATLDLLYVGDVVAYIQKALALSDLVGSETFNLASGELVSVEQVAHQIESVIGEKLERHLIDTPVRNISIDTSKLIHRLGKMKLTPLQDGLKNQIRAAMQQDKGKS